MTQRDTNRYDDFDALVARHRKLIRGLCWWKAGGKAWLMSELIQEVTTQLWHYRHKLHPDVTPGEEREWVRFHCRSVFAHRKRKGEREVEVVPIEEAANVAADEGNHTELIDRLAANLTLQEHRVLELILDDYTDGEIAFMLRIDENEVKRLHASVIEKMKQNANNW
ncbi:MAG: sigma-70 family RNA polymerase sigma factor [Bacteroidales bacterium]|nr:sigma-70 family RNA polymerase sigma factor [Bacteroidales bacterium]